MTITWNSNNLCFNVAYSVFEMEKVKENVEQAVSQVYHLQVSRFQGLLLSCNERQGIPLDKKSLVTFKEKLETGTLSQLHSKSSILLYDDRFLYKYIINDKERETTYLLILLSDHIKRSILPKKCDMLAFPGTPYFVYDRILPPLLRDEARTCLSSFERSVLEAVVDLHECGRAHLDIRLLSRRSLS